MTDPDTAPQMSGCGRILLLLIGSILLLPGVCSILFAVELNVGGGGRIDPGIMLIWIVTFMIAAAGMGMIALARRSRPPDR